MVNTSKSYGIIELNGQQIQIQLGCYYDRKPPSSKLVYSRIFKYKRDEVYVQLAYKFSYWYINKNIMFFYRIVLFCNKVGLWFGMPWMENLTIKGHLKRFSVSPKIIIYKMSRKKKKRKKAGYCHDTIRFFIQDIRFYNHFCVQPAIAFV